MMMKLFVSIQNGLYMAYLFVISLLTRVCKWVMRKLTRQTEVQRCVYGEIPGCRRIRRTEKSLLWSRNSEIQEQLKILEDGVAEGRFLQRGTRKALVLQSTAKVTSAKRINLKLHSRFVTGLAECLEVVYTIKCLNVKLHQLRSTPYDSENPVHEEKLLRLWKNMKEGEELSGRKSRQWQDIGFQGNDPATDFRGAGILALDALLHISSSYPDVTKKLLEHSHHPLYSYPFALLCIQITFLATDLCRNGAAKSHFYNRFGVILRLDDAAAPNDTIIWERELLKLFFELCCALICDFDTMWLSSKPKDIMEYGRIKSEFDQKILRKLKHDDTCFLMEVRTI